MGVKIFVGGGERPQRPNASYRPAMYTVQNIAGLGIEIKMNIDINFSIDVIHVLNIDINFDIIEIHVLNIDINFVGVLNVQVCY